MSPKGKRRSLIRRLALWTLAFLVVLTVVSVVVLRVYFRGARLGKFATKQLNGRILGHLDIGKIDWDTSDLPKVVSGGWLPVRIHGFVLHDALGRKVIDIPDVDAEIDAHAIMFGNHDLVLRHMHVKRGAWALIRLVEEPYPVHEYDLNVVSILSAFYTKKSPAIYVGLSAAPAAMLDFRDFEVDDLTLKIELDYFTGELDRVNAHGFLYADDSDPLSRKLYYTVTAHAPSGHLDIEGRTVPLENIDIPQLEQLPKKWPRDPYATDAEWTLTADSKGAKIDLAGGMYNYWQNYFGGEYHTRLTLRDAGDLARLLSSTDPDTKLDQGSVVVSGKGLFVDTYVDGPVLAPKVELQLGNVHLDVPISSTGPPLGLDLASATAAFDLATAEGYLEQTVARGAGGELQLQATFALGNEIHPLQFDVNVDIPVPIELRPYLPRPVIDLAGTKLRGSLHAYGTSDAQRIDNLKLWLGKAHLSGELYRESGQTVHAKSLVATVGGTRLAMRDSLVDFASEELNLTLDLLSSDAPRYLRYFGAPAVAKRLSGSARVHGSFSAPVASAQLQAGGVPLVNKVDARLSYQRDVLALEHVSSHKLGGALSARGHIRLAPSARVLDFSADARDLDVTRLPVIGDLLAGIANIHVSAAGPPTRLDVDGTASVAGMAVAGDQLRTFEVRVDGDPDGGQTVEVNIERTLGGQLHAAVTRDRHDGLGGVVSIRDLPVESMSFIADRPQDSTVGAHLDAELALGGTVEAPTADGTIDLGRAWFGDAFLGAASLVVKPAGAGLIAVTGHLFQGKLEIAGTLQTRAPYSADLTVKARRVELDQFLPALHRDYAARGWASGELAIHTQLAPRPGFQPKATLRLTELTLLRDNVDPQGRPAPIRLSNRTPLVVQLEGDHAQIEGEALFRGPGGDFKVSGGGTRGALALKLQGGIAMAMLQPYLRDYFDDMKGTLGVAVDVTGPLAKPLITGTVQFDGVSVQPVGQDAEVSVPSGRVTVTPSQVAITDFTVRMVNHESDERAELKIRGGIGMQSFVPTVWALQIEGQLAGKMLLVAAPQIFSAAGGMAYVNVWLRGPGEAPDDIDGTVWFECPKPNARSEQTRADYALVGKRCKIDRPLTLAARGVRHQISLDTGAIRIEADDARADAQVLAVRGLGGWIDDEGRLQNLQGEVTMENWQVVDFDVGGTARSLPLRIPRELDLTVDVENFEVVGGPDSGLDVKAQVEILDGRYVRNFNLAGFLETDRTMETTTPFYEAIPLIANAKLDIGIDTRAFFVQNNVANIQLSGGVNIRGTPVAPRFDGAINVNQGTFKFQGMKARFTRTTGSVTFSGRKQFPDETPTLDVQSEADFRDSNGTDHVIQLTIFGTLSNFNYDLTTDTGLNKGQTLMLISSGRRPEDLRQSLGDSQIGADPTRLDSTAEGGNVYDELVKDLAGDFISLLIEDKLRDLTNLDVARLEIGTASVGFHLEKDLFENLRILGDLQRNVRGWEGNVRTELRVTDSVSMEADYVQRNQEDNTDQNRSEGRLRMVWRRSWQ